jgi:dolichyl-phosphate beta-glucosyltransferase
VIPAYNEELRIEATVRKIDAFLSEQEYDGELVVVDDGSRDRTSSMLSALRGEVRTLRILRFEANRGKGHAVRAGVLAAARDCVLFTDADLATPIEEVERLWPVLDRGGSVAIASRHLPGGADRVDQPWRRRWVGRAFNLCVSMLALRGIRDTQCGFKLFRTRAARRIFEGVRTEGFAFDVEALCRARALGYRIAEVPVRWIDRPGSRVRLARDSVQMLSSLIRMRPYGLPRKPSGLP